MYPLGTPWDELLFEVELEVLVLVRVEVVDFFVVVSLVCDVVLPEEVPDVVVESRVVVESEVVSCDVVEGFNSNVGMELGGFAVTFSARPTIPVAAVAPKTEIITMRLRNSRLSNFSPPMPF